MAGYANGRNAGGTKKAADIAAGKAEAKASFQCMARPKIF